MPGYVEVPMFELMAAFSLSEHLSAATFEENGKVGYVRVISPSRRPYKTRDGWVGVLPYTQRNWTKILQEIGRADVVEFAWFKDATERSRRVDELYDMLAVAMVERTTCRVACDLRAARHSFPARALAQRPAAGSAPARRRVLPDELRQRHADGAVAAAGGERRKR